MFFVQTIRKKCGIGEKSSLELWISHQGVLGCSPGCGSACGAGDEALQGKPRMGRVRSVSPLSPLLPCLMCISSRMALPGIAQQQRWTEDPANSSRVGHAGVSLRWDFPPGDQGCVVLGAETTLKVPPCASPRREEKKKENPFKIPDFQCWGQLWNEALGDLPVLWDPGVLWNKEENSFPPARASLMMCPWFSLQLPRVAAIPRGKFPPSWHSQHLLLSFPAPSWGRLFLSCCVLVKL